jgi:hypothetical protein
MSKVTNSVSSLDSLHACCSPTVSSLTNQGSNLNCIENDLFDVNEFNIFDMDRYFSELITPDYESTTNNINNMQSNNPQTLLNTLDDITLSPPRNQFPPYLSNFDPVFNDTISSFDFAKDIDDFNSLFLSLEPTEELYNDNSNLLSPINNSNNLLNETVNPINSNNTNTTFSNFSSIPEPIINSTQSIKNDKKSKTLFDELRDLIPVISFTPSQQSNQNSTLKTSSKSNSNTTNNFIKNLSQETTESKRLHRQKALARYRAKKLNRMTSRNRSQNTMYVERQAVAFRRPRNNGRFMGLQTHYISVTQFSNSSSST